MIHPLNPANPLYPAYFRIGKGREEEHNDDKSIKKVNDICQELAKENAKSSLKMYDIRQAYMGCIKKSDKPAQTDEEKEKK